MLALDAQSRKITNLVKEKTFVNEGIPHAKDGQNVYDDIHISKNMGTYDADSGTSYGVIEFGWYPNPGYYIDFNYVDLSGDFVIEARSYHMNNDDYNKSILFSSIDKYNDTGIDDAKMILYTSNKDRQTEL